MYYWHVHFDEWTPVPVSGSVSGSYDMLTIKFNLRLTELLRRGRSPYDPYSLAEQLVAYINGVAEVPILGWLSATTDTNLIQDRVCIEVCCRFLANTVMPEMSIDTDVAIKVITMYFWRWYVVMFYPDSQETHSEDVDLRITIQQTIAVGCYTARVP